MEIVEIDKDDLVRLVRDKEWGDALYNEGVENWDWYDDTLEDYHNMTDDDFKYIANKYIKTSIESLYRQLQTKINTYPTIGFVNNKFTVSYMDNDSQLRVFVGDTIRNTLQTALNSFS